MSKLASDVAALREQGLVVSPKVPPVPTTRVALQSFEKLMTGLLDSVVDGKVGPDQANAACKVAEVMLKALEIRLKFEERE